MSLFQRLFLVLALAVPATLIIGRAVSDITMAVVSLGFLAHSLYRRDFSWLRQRWVQAALVVWAWLVFSALLADFDVKESLERALAWGRFPLFAAAFSCWLLPLDQNQKWLRRSLVALVVLVAIDALVQFFFGMSLSGHAKPTYPGRLSGAFTSGLVVGVFLTRLSWPAIGLTLGRFSNETTLWKRYLPALALAGLLCVTILLSGERMAFGVFLISAGFFWLGAKHLRLPLFIMGVSAIALAVTTIFFTPSLHKRFIGGSGEVFQDFRQSTYGVIWANAIKAWKVSPITGVGPKNFATACETLGATSGFEVASPWHPGFDCARHPHNIYLEWLAETGVVGVALFLMFIGVIVRGAWINLRGKTELRDYFPALGFLIGLVPFLWPAAFTMSFFSNWSAVLFWWVLAFSLPAPRPVTTSIR